MSKKTGTEKVHAMIDAIKTAMLVTEDAHGHLRSRPMHTSEVDEEGNIWFFTDNFSTKTDEIAEDRQINLAYADNDSEDYLSVSGKARIVHDQNKINELWNPMLKAWFPEGKDASNVALLRVTPIHAEYWDAAGSTLVELIKMGKAVLTGTKYQSDGHEKVQL